jgi:hypothetical protein
MPAATYNIIAEQGATFSQTILYTDASETPIDLTNYTAEMHVRTTVASASTIIELSTSDSSIILDGVNGTIELAITATAMSDIPAAKYYYDLELYGENDLIVRLIEGRFTVKAEVTRQ